MFDITSRVVQLLGVGLKANGQASLSSDTALASAGTRKALGEAAMSAESGTTAAGSRTAFGAASLTAESDLQSGASATLYVAMTGDFDSVLSGAANATFRSVTASLTADTSVAADGGILYGGSTAMSADTDLAGSGTTLAQAAAALSSGSHFGAYAERYVPAAADLVSDLAVDVTAAPVRKRFGEAALDGDLATMEATAYISMPGAADLSGEATSFLATASPVFRLRMATAKRSITDDWLLKRYPIDAGLSLIVTGGVVREVEVPSQTELAEADYYFLGGRDNPITPGQRATLVAAGYGSYIEEG